MRAASLFIAAGTAAAASNASTACAPGGLYILCARGSGEPAISKDPSWYPDNTGASGYLASQIVLKLPRAIIDGVIYPATNPTSETNLTSYYASENAGAKAIVAKINEYSSACPGDKIALIGYSQVCATVLFSMRPVCMLIRLYRELR